jgi:hypothetical protein
MQWSFARREGERVGEVDVQGEVEVVSVVVAKRTRPGLYRVGQSSPIAVVTLLL